MSELLQACDLSFKEEVHTTDCVTIGFREVLQNCTHCDQF